MANGKAWLRACEVVVRKKDRGDGLNNNALRKQVVQWLHDQAYFVEQHWAELSNTTRLRMWRNDQ